MSPQGDRQFAIELQEKTTFPGPEPSVAESFRDPFPPIFPTSQIPEDLHAEQSREAIAEIEKAIRSVGGSITRDEKHLPPYGLSDHDLGSLLTTIAFTVPTAGVLVAVLRSVTALAQQWLKNRSERTIQITVGDKKMSITGSDDVEKAIHAAQQLEKLSKRAGSAKDIVKNPQRAGERKRARKPGGQRKKRPLAGR